MGKLFLPARCGAVYALDLQIAHAGNFPSDLLHLENRKYWNACREATGIAVKILVTGGAGFIGSHCVEAFVARGDEVAVLDLRPPAHTFDGTYVAADLLDRNAVEEAVRASDLVIHAGGILGTDETITSVIDATRTNVLGALHVLDAVRRYGNGLINISKPNVWLNPYSITKDSVEKFCFMYVNEFATKIAVVKMFNVYGPRQAYTDVKKAVPTWIVNALKGQPVEIFGEGNSTMDLIFIRDVVEAVIVLVDQFDKCRIRRHRDAARNVYSNFEAYNEQVLQLGSGREITVKSAVKELEQALVDGI
jgi:UDP-glucose 4-epimerase